MNRIKKRKLGPLIALAFAGTVLLTACGGGQDSTPSVTYSVATSAPANTRLAGYVAFDMPIANATVKVYAAPKAAGAAPLATVTTNQNGLFDAGSLQLKDFSVEVSNIVLSDGTKLDGTMKAELRNYSARSTVYVNAATTLVSAYMAAKPTLTQEQAETAVRNFLGLPADQNLGAGLMKPSSVFSNSQFLMQALDAKGLDSFVASLVSEMQSSPTATHSFAQKMLQDAAGGGLFTPTGIGLELAKGIIGAVGGEAAKKVMSSLGLGGADQSAEILNQLNIINAKLDALAKQLANTDRLILQGQWSDRVSGLASYINKVQENYQTFLMLAGHTPDEIAKDKSLAYAENDMYNAICELKSDRWRVFQEMSGQLGSTPLVMLYSQVKTAAKRYYSPAASADYQSVIEQLGSVQVAMFHMYSRYLLAGRASSCAASYPADRLKVDISDPVLQQHAKDYISMNDAVAAKTPKPLPPDVTLDMDQNQMIYTPKAGYPWVKIGVLPWINGSRWAGHWQPDLEVGGTAWVPYYDPNDMNTAWNYATIYMNSDNSPMPSSPAFLRKSWYLPTNDIFFSVFINGIDSAIAQGFPDYQRDTIAWIAYDYEKYGHPDGCTRIALFSCEVLQHYNVRTNTWMPIYNAGWSATVLPFRGLTDDERKVGYYYYRP